MSRDFTYIDDLVDGMRLLIDASPARTIVPEMTAQTADSKSRVAPFRLVNIGNSKPAKLLDFISAIEKSIGNKAVQNLLPMQAGDVPATWADTSLLEELTGYKPKTDLQFGVQKFVTWYRDYYNI